MSDFAAVRGALEAFARWPHLWPSAKKQTSATREMEHKAREALAALDHIEAEDKKLRLIEEAAREVDRNVGSEVPFHQALRALRTALQGGADE